MRLFETIKGRRDFFRTSGRYIALGLLAVIGGVALLRKRDGNCDPYPLCKGCGVFNDCSLPQALQQKNNSQERRNG